jgi:NADH-quinone oxidoreductase subunit J
VNLVDLLFYIFSTLVLGGALLMVCSRHPVSAAMFMIVSLVGVAALFVLLEAFFLAILQVLVYAGAVMVLFLFIIMLLDVGPDGGKAFRMKLVSGLAAAFSVALLLVVFLVMVQSTGWLNGSSGTWDPVPSGNQLTEGQNLIFSTAVKNFGYGLMTKYMLPLQVSGFLLLAAMVGVIVLSKKEGNEVS